MGDRPRRTRKVSVNKIDELAEKTLNKANNKFLTQAAKKTIAKGTEEVPLRSEKKQAEPKAETPQKPTSISVPDKTKTNNTIESIYQLNTLNEIPIAELFSKKLYPTVTSSSQENTQIPLDVKNLALEIKNKLALNHGVKTTVKAIISNVFLTYYQENKDKF